MSKKQAVDFHQKKRRILGIHCDAAGPTHQLKQTKQAVFNHVFYCRGDKTGNLISTTKLARTNLIISTGETGEHRSGMQVRFEAD
ncbi:hypothetical protein MHYP_G00266880 [Metynnis hypsauchen]